MTPVKLPRLPGRFNAPLPKALIFFVLTPLLLCCGIGSVAAAFGDPNTGATTQQPSRPAAVGPSIAATSTTTVTTPAPLPTPARTTPAPFRHRPRQRQQQRRASRSRPPPRISRPPPRPTRAYIPARSARLIGPTGRRALACSCSASPAPATPASGGVPPSSRCTWTAAPPFPTSTAS
jgi:hypothetical protein